MKLTKIQKVLTKTDLGLSGKNGVEIILDKKSKKYFNHIPKNGEVEFINLETFSKLKLTKKIETSEKFTAKNLQKIYMSLNLQEGDVVELFIFENNDKYIYGINFKYTNVLIFQKHKGSGDYYSLSDEKLKHFFSQEPLREITVNINSKENTIKLIESTTVKLRADAKIYTQLYKVEDVPFEIFSINLDNNNLGEIKKASTVSEFIHPDAADDKNIEPLDLTDENNTKEPYKNILLKGVPGTGKSHLLDKLVEKIKVDLSNVKRINIHSASSNADLMQGIGIGNTKDGDIKYSEKQGLIFEHIIKDRRGSDVRIR